MSIAFGESASLSGNTASRPDPDATKIGRFYHDTQTGITYRDTGSTWEVVGRASVEAHSHAESDVTNLTTDLSGKAASSHSHAESDVTNLTTDLGTLAPIGYQAYALPPGYSVQNNLSANLALAAVAGGNGGAILVPIPIQSHMLLDNCSLVCADTGLLRSAEWRLYREPSGGNATLDEVANANGTWSFTPTALSLRSSQAASAPVALTPGAYWLAIRNTSASNAFNLRYNDAINLTINFCLKKAIPTLGNTLSMASGWTKAIHVPGVALLGRVFAESAGF